MRASKTNTAPRKDPRSKATDGSTPANHLSNTDPTRKYTLVDPNNKFFGQAYFESRGYRVERKEEGGVRFTNGGTRSENGDVLMLYDLVLMSCSMEDHLERKEVATARADAKEASMTKGRNKFNQVPGVFGLPATGNYGIHVVNETDPTQVVTSRA
jgi:hypothetical protein